MVVGVSLGRPATCGKGKELIAPSSPAFYHHLTVLLDTYRQVALLKSLLLLSLTRVSWGRGGGWYNYKRGKRRHMILLSPDWTHILKARAVYVEGKKVLSGAGAHWEEISGQRKWENKKGKAGKMKATFSFVSAWQSQDLAALLSRKEKNLVGLKCSPVTYLQFLLWLLVSSSFPFLQSHEHLEHCFSLLSLFFKYWEHGTPLWSPSASTPPQIQTSV